MTNEWCAACGKYRYPTKARAEAVIDSGVFEKGETRPRSVYRCPDCFGWHLTSQVPGRYYQRKRRTRALRKVTAATLGGEG